MVLAALTVLLPFLAAFAGMLGGPALSRGLSRLLSQPGGKGRVDARAAQVLGNGPAWIAVVPMAVAAVLSLIVALSQWQDPGARTGTLTRIPTGSLQVSVGFLVDGQAAAVAFMVCCVALAVQLYSVAYMAGDRRYSSYAAFISLFTAAMLLVVFSGDLLVLYAGWEVMGVCSYFLIGHHWEDRANSRAAVKAFLVTRIGDVGFLLGIIVLGAGARSFSIPVVLDRVADLPGDTLLAATLLLLAGVAGKSAQFPLHTWLPDAMAGPTPISALIHAATMVAAGIYVVARLFPAFLDAPASLAVLGVMASISMLGSALAALAQPDLKRVLAYSTISQLAYMAAGLAVGSRSGALFHLLTHGAFKALLFLAAGCVIYAVGGNLLRDMGGLRLALPVTFWSMTVGFAALAGIPPTSGFYSKDAIIEAAHETVTAGGLLGGPGHMTPAVSIPGPIAWLIYVTLLLTVAVTAAYAMRAWLMVFFGERRSAPSATGAAAPQTAPHAAVSGDPSDSAAASLPAVPGLMRYPVAVLAVPALILGFFGLGAPELRPHPGSAALAFLLTVAGAGAAWLLWRRDPARDPARALGPFRGAFERAFLVDELYSALIVRPVRGLARLVVRTDDQVVDAAVRGTGPAARGLGGVLRLLQNGNAQAYLTGVLAGTVLVVFAVVMLG